MQPLFSPRHGPAALLLAALWLGAATGAAGQPVDAEKLVKVHAAFLLNFVRLTTWPPPEPGAGGGPKPLRVLVAGDPALASALEAVLRGRLVHGRPVAVTSLSFPDAPPTPTLIGRLTARLADADALVLGAVPDPWRAPLAHALREGPEPARPRLLVTRERWGVDARFAHLAFTVRDGRVAFLLSVSALEASPLRLSSKLLALAERLP